MDDAAEQFPSLKAKRGLKNNSELVRQLITEKNGIMLFRKPKTFHI